jgi:N6-adenosine-specific RNA methylase IME4
MRLVAGHHRLLACKSLGWETITSLVRDLAEVDAQLAEIDENLIREDLSAAERAELTARRKALYLAKHPETGHGKAPGAGKGKGKVDRKESKVDSFVDSTSKKAGRSKTRVREDVRRGEKVAQEVLDEVKGTNLDTGTNLDALTRMEPEQQQEVVAYAREKGIDNVKTAARDLKRAKTAEAINAEPQPLPTGPFRVIVADPPWKYDLRDDDPTHRGTVDYTRMEVSEICAMDVAARAHEDCVLWLWTTNAHMHDDFHVLEAWGFEQKTILTWAKGRTVVELLCQSCYDALEGSKDAVQGQGRGAKEGSGELLSAQGKGAWANGCSEGVRALRGSIHGSHWSQDEVLQSKLRGEGKVRRDEGETARVAEEASSEGMVGAGRLHLLASPGQPDGGQEWVRRGAQSRDVKGSGASTDSRGTGASQEQDQDRQQAGESGDRVPRIPFEGALEARDDLVSKVRPCDRCGAPGRIVVERFVNKIGAGHWLRGQTEHCLLATKGKPTILMKSESTLLHGEVREHSRKPESFYELVDKICPGAKLELFGRQQREGWTCWGAESEKFDAGS